MEGEVIVITPTRLKEIVVEAVSIALKYHPLPTAPAAGHVGSTVDFGRLCREYYPGIPESTVRQDTAGLPRTKVGKRVLFERVDVEAHLLSKRRASTAELDQAADAAFTTQHQRSGGRKVA